MMVVFKAGIKAKSMFFVKFAVSQSIFRHMKYISKHIGRALALVSAVIMMTSCGDSDSFTVEGKIEDKVTMNVRYLYYANGLLNKGVTASRDGKFELKGVSQTPTILEIMDNDYRPLGRLYIANGDRIECSLTRGNPYAIKVKGSDDNCRWADFLNENSVSLTGNKANETIEKYVGDHSDDIVSTLLMLTSYDSSRNALRADSIMTSINQDVRPAVLVDGYNSMLQRLVMQTVSEAVMPIPYFSRKDSLLTFNPGHRPLSIVIMSDETSGRRDSIVPALKRLKKLKNSDKLQMMDFSMDRDTVKWHRSILSDSASWKQGWVAGSIASPGIDRLGIPRLPYFIVTDSTGNQMLRTASVSEAENFISSRLKSL